MLPPPIAQLARLLTRLPGVGDKTAHRFALFLATADAELCEQLAVALDEVAHGVARCARCGHLATVGDGEPRCAICADPKRDGSLLCIVASIQHLMSIERSGAVRGTYFVLGKLLSPLEGVHAHDLPLDAIKRRIQEPGAPVSEVLVATPPSVDGEATALLLAQELQPLGVRMTRLASGVPHGGDLEFADPVTLGRAVSGRRGLG